MAVIRKDKHGLYAIFGGYVFRPDYPAGYTHLDVGYSSFKAGDNKPTRHYGGSPMGRVGKNCEYHEIWYSHGPSHKCIDGKAVKLNSEDVYRPSYDTWVDYE